MIVVRCVLLNRGGVGLLLPLRLDRFEQRKKGQLRPRKLCGGGGRPHICAALKRGARSQARSHEGTEVNHYPGHNTVGTVGN